MAFSNNLLCVSKAAKIALPQYCIVEMTAVANEVTTAAAGQGFGIVQNAPGVGEAATVAVQGESRCRAGGTVTLGQFITAAASGFASVVGSAGTNGRILGRAVTSAASGSTFTLDIVKFSVSSGAAL